MKKGISLLPTILLIVVLVTLIGGAYYLGKRTNSPKSSSSFPMITQTPTTLPQPTPQVADPLFSGIVKKIDKDLGLFKLSDSDKENGVADYLVYYEAGTYLKGTFKGYTRILAIRPSEGPGPAMQFILATKDFSTYVLDDPNNKTTKYPEDDWDNPYLYLDKSKITKVTALDSNHPKIIVTNKPFELIRQDSILLENKPTGKKDKNSNDIYLESPITAFSQSMKLTSTQTQLSLYAGGTSWGTGEGYSGKEKKDLETRKKYLNKTTYVYAPDSTGLTYTYVLSTEKDINEYLSNAAAEEGKMIYYKKQVALYNEKKLATYPEYPKTAPFPGLRLTKASAGLATDFYTTYESAFPGACGGNQSTYIVDGLIDSDFTAISSSSLYPLFTLKDTSDALYDLSYNTKTGQGEESFKSVNEGISMPTRETYVAKHPLLFFKDAWGRWTVIGEFDLKLMGGCGKPVVYLYPEKQTTVHISFGTPVILNTNIPTYQNGWLVSASPDGTLTDLQPQYTDCSKIDGTQFGSEYAINACKSNSYPYIYWTGKSVENAYPKETGGWIVSKDAIYTLMQEKLKEIGLTAKESDDMTSYWVPKMMEKNMPYYRISFLQTGDMNNFIPMNVSPRPDSIVRVFLDWKPLASKPSVALAPQKLERMQRKGFTLVEWGGLR